jgi:Tfp pilus assembly protein PilO
VILVVFMLAYRTNRAKKVKLMRADLARVSAEKDRLRTVEAEVARITRMIPTESGVSLFIESLYRAAKEAGLKQHEVSTETNKAGGSARPGGSNTTEAVIKQNLKVTVSGGYRNFAEYVRRVQNIERFNRITDFKLSPDTDQLKGTLTLELYSLPVK